VLSPLSFIALAEETGLIDEVGEHILSEATTQVCGWNRDKRLQSAIDVSVNLSPRQLLDPRLPKLVEDVLGATALLPAQLIIEITEGAMVQDAEAAARNANALHDLGVRLAVDDFGTGYSSLTHLQRFPIDIVKIDRSFVAGVDGLPAEAALAKAIVRLAQTLGLDVIAEGVETPGQAQRLRAIGCNLAQGFYLAEPVSGPELLRLLRGGPLCHAGMPAVAHR
jgi:EAL domain-containing protein (putative c-di-GMP-specific phosphodiesterase class I)